MSNFRPIQPSEQPAPRGVASWEDWAYAYLVTDSLEHKLAPPELPKTRDHGRAQHAEPTPEVRALRPGRPRELALSWDKYKAPKSAHALRNAQKRAHLLHTFFHHELQAAELMCWALLAYPDTPEAFARGLLNVCMDEIRHMNMYRAQIEKLGFALGAFPVRDWFWERAPEARSAPAFLALMGLGFEAGNLDHSQRFEHLFREANDAEAAELMHLVGEEEVAHVAFAAHWFQKLAGPLSFEAWRAALPAPLSPMVMRGRPLAEARRLRAGFNQDFLARLSAWQPASPGG
jgi:uncharacterized ferritin-like protein (DUF455 family)